MITAKQQQEQGYDRFSASINYLNSPESFVNLQLMPPFDNMEFVSSVNGIVCVCNGTGNDVFLFNPLTRFYKRLPKDEKLVPFRKEPDKVDVVFGFNCVSDEFKVVRVRYRKNDISQLVSVHAVELYSSNADLWRDVEVNVRLPSFVCFPFRLVLISGPVVNGLLYLEGRDKIVTFDLDMEMFGVIPFPGFMQRRKSNVFYYKGSVVVVVESVRDGSLDEAEISLWVAVAVSDELFWNKVFTFEAGLGIDWVFLCLGDNQFVGTTRLGTMLYNYRKKATKYFGLPSESFLLKVLKHNESFLSMKGFEGLEES